MAKPPKRGQREQLITTFQKRKNPRARTSGRPNTTPANLTKKPGIPAPRQFSASSTFKRSEGSGIYNVPLLGQALVQRNKIRAGRYPGFGDPEGIPPASRAARKGTPYRRSRRSRLRGSRYN